MIGRTISHYKILNKLGEGGMGVVYEAEDTRLERSVALKFLPRELTSQLEIKERFLREAQTASSLDHPNVCTIHEIDETEDGQLFICMAMCTGETLLERLRRGPLDLTTGIEYILQIAAGLSRAHEQGIIHRDIKPANVMVNEHGELKILDFGVAKRVGMATMTTAGAAIGTLAYMCPEQAEGRTVDHRADIWSLGAVLFEVVTGTRPFPANSVGALLNAICNVEPTDPGTLDRLPVRLKEIISITAKTPNPRTNNAPISQRPITPQRPR